MSSRPILSPFHRLIFQENSPAVEIFFQPIPERQVQVDHLRELEQSRAHMLDSPIRDARRALSVPLLHDAMHWLRGVKWRTHQRISFPSFSWDVFCQEFFPLGLGPAPPVPKKDRRRRSRARRNTQDDAAIVMRTSKSGNPPVIAPLAPTHILTVIPPSIQQGEPRLDISVEVANFVEVPINLLVFAVNAPNLCTVLLPSPQEYGVLERLVTEMPDLKTFPAFNVYLRTQNQARLFWTLLPKWVQVVMSPLPPIPSQPTQRLRNEDPSQTTKRLGRFMSKTLSRWGSEVSPSQRTVESVARDLHDAWCKVKASRDVKSLKRSVKFNLASISTDFRPPTSSPHAKGEFGTHTCPPEDDVDLVDVAAILAELKQNISRVGLGTPELINELHLGIYILDKAIEYQAREAADLAVRCVKTAHGLTLSS